MIKLFTTFSRWAHPLGVRQSALWSSCPVLDKPEGVKEVTCENATCMAVCEDGKVAMGRRRIKCRWKRKKGFFWKRVSSYLRLRSLACRVAYLYLSPFLQQFQTLTECKGCSHLDSAIDSASRLGAQT